MADGKTYADLGVPAERAQGQGGRGPRRPTTPPLADLQNQLTAITAQRETLFKGETLRGLLLTSFGFSVFGVKGEQVATVAYIVAGLLALLSLAGFAHALKTPKTKAFGRVHGTFEDAPDEKTLVSV